MRVTIADLARRAGVSTATVDRVVNDRPGVHPRTYDLVRRTALELGLDINIAFDGAVQDGRLPSEATNAGAGGRGSADMPHIAFVLPGGSNAFMDVLAACAEKLDGSGARVTVHRTDGLTPEATVAVLERVRDEVEALAVVALDAPPVREALRAFVEVGKPVLAIVSPISVQPTSGPMSGYVGVDNRSAGRLAGQLVARLVRERDGSVGFLAGNLSYRGHEEREMGFRSVLKTDAPGLAIVAVSETEDDNERCRAGVADLIARYSDLRAVYNVGGGNRGVARALEEAGRADIVYIGHEFTAHTRRYLISGLMDVAIVQSPAEEAHRAVERLSAAVARHGEVDSKTDNLSARDGFGHTVLPLQVVFRENVPA